MKIYSKELQEYLDSTLSAIREGVENDHQFRIVGPIEFDLAVTNIKEGRGGLKIYVASAEGKLKTERVSRIKFKIEVDRSKEIEELNKKLNAPAAEFFSRSLGPI